MNVKFCMPFGIPLVSRTVLHWPLRMVPPKKDNATAFPPVPFCTVTVRTPLKASADVAVRLIFLATAELFAGITALVEGRLLSIVCILNSPT